VSGQTITGRQETKIDQMGNATDSFYDLAGRLTDVYLPAVADALNSNAMTRPHWQYAYDLNGQQSSQTDPKGNVTSFTYDEFGRRTGRTLPLTQTETSSYDSHGRLSQSVDFKGNTTVYVYFDSGANAGRVQYKRYFTPGQALNTTPNQEVEYTYDELGRAESIIERSAGSVVQTTAYEYDSITGGMTLETLHDESSSSYAKILRHAYNETSGRLTATWTASSLVSAVNLAEAQTAAITLTEYEYDDRGRLWQTILKRVNSTTVSKTTYNTYDALGMLDTVTQPNLVETDYGYDDLNRLTSVLVVDDEADKLFEQTYTLLDNGQRDYVIEKRYNGSSSTPTGTIKIDWDYDATNRLTEEIYDVGNDGPDSADYKHSYSFDLSGNRIFKSIDTGNNSSIDHTIRSTYNDNDQLLWVSNNGDDDSNGTYETGDVQYTYDPNGSTTRIVTTGGSTVKQVWDVRSRMIGFDANGDDDNLDTGDATYRFDDAGNRISKTVVGTGDTFYVFNGLNPTGYSKSIEERSTVNGSPVVTYILGLNVIGQANASGTLSYLLRDGHGTTRALTDSSGAVLSGTEYDYDAFGNALNFTAGSAATVWLAPDGTYEAESKLTRQDGRLFDRAIGRANSQDPTTFGPGALRDANLYVYASGNPIFYTDPSGMFSMSEMLNNTGIQNQLHALHLPRAFSIYNTASNIREASQILAQVIRGAPYDGVSAAFFALQFLPVGKILGGLKGIAGKFTGSLGPKVAGELDELYRSAKVFDKTEAGLAQMIGETGAAMAAKAHGLVETEFRAAYRGLDSVLQDPVTKLFYVVEAKGGTSTLRGAQLGSDWIKQKVAKIIAESEGLVSDDAILQLRSQLRDGDLRVMLAETPIVNNVVQETSFYIKKAGEIGAKFFD
jgi:RHS repeat-associated protein